MGKNFSLKSESINSNMLSVFLSYWFIIDAQILLGQIMSYITLKE